MGYKRAITAIATLAVAFEISGCASIPKSYDDCILAKVGPQLKEPALGVVIGSCRSKFHTGPESSRTRALVDSEIHKVAIQWPRGHSTQFSGAGYNGNTDVEVVGVHMRVTLKSGDSFEYRTGVSIQPLSANQVYFNLLPAHSEPDATWELIGASGREVE